MESQNVYVVHTLLEKAELLTSKYASAVKNSLPSQSMPAFMDIPERNSIFNYLWKLSFTVAQSARSAELKIITTIVCWFTLDFYMIL